MITRWLRERRKRKELRERQGQIGYALMFGDDPYDLANPIPRPERKQPCCGAPVSAWHTTSCRYKGDWERFYNDKWGVS